MNEDTQHITLQLDAHRVPMNVLREKEPIYREAAALLNKRYQHYVKAMPRASAEELWVYVALEQAVNLCNDARMKKIEPVENKLDELNRKIAQSL